MLTMLPQNGSTRSGRGAHEFYTIDDECNEFASEHLFSETLSDEICGAYHPMRGRCLAPIKSSTSIHDGVECCTICNAVRGKVHTLASAAALHAVAGRAIQPSWVGSEQQNAFSFADGALNTTCWSADDVAMGSTATYLTMPHKQTQLSMRRPEGDKLAEEKSRKQSLKPSESDRKKDTVHSGNTKVTASKRSTKLQTSKLELGLKSLKPLSSSSSSTSSSTTTLSSTRLSKTRVMSTETKVKVTEKVSVSFATSGIKRKRDESHVTSEFTNDRDRNKDESRESLPSEQVRTVKKVASSTPGTGSAGASESTRSRPRKRVRRLTTRLTEALEAGHSWLQGSEADNALRRLPSEVYAWSDCEDTRAQAMKHAERLWNEYIHSRPAVPRLGCRVWQLFLLLGTHIAGHVVLIRHWATAVAADDEKRSSVESELRSTWMKMFSTFARSRMLRDELDSERLTAEAVGVLLRDVVEDIVDEESVSVESDAKRIGASLNALREAGYFKRPLMRSQKQRQTLTTEGEVYLRRQNLHFFMRPWLLRAVVVFCLAGRLTLGRPAKYMRRIEKLCAIPSSAVHAEAQAARRILPTQRTIRNAASTSESERERPVDVLPSETKQFVEQDVELDTPISI